MTTTDQIQELSATLDRDVDEAQERANAAVENLRRAQDECEAANKAIVELQKQREGFRHTFAAVLGITEVHEEAPEEDAAPVEESEARSLKLVPSVAANDKQYARRPKVDFDLASMTQKEQVKHLLGDRTLTLGELREAFQQHALEVPGGLASLLYKNKDTVFSSPAKGSWRVKEPDDSEYTTGEVLTVQEELAEVRSRLPAVRRQ